MQIRLYGFQWKTGQGISTPEFLEYLSLCARDPIEFAGHKREIYLKDLDNGYWAGLILSIKDHKRFITRRQEFGKIRLGTHEVTGDDRIADANFFVIHPASSKGLYAYYHQSLSPNRSEGLLKFYYKYLKEDRAKLMATEMAKKSVGGLSDKDLKRINKKLKGLIEVQVILRNDSVETLLAEFDEFQSFKFRYARILPDEDEFRGLRNVAKTEAATVTFKQSSTKQQIISGIANTIRRVHIPAGLVKGKTADGTDKTIKIGKNASVFEEWDFDQAAERFDFDVDELDETPMIEDIMESVIEHEAFFPKPKQ